MQSSIEAFLQAEERLAPAETEDAYYAAYRGLPLPPVQAGIPAKGKRVAFFVHAANLLAHVQMMRGVLRPDDRVFVFKADADGFRNLLPCPVISLPQLPLVERFEALRERLQEHQCGTLIWLSVPRYARYAFAIRLAQKQVFWTLRYHPIAPGDINITAGKRDEKTRAYHGYEWRCVHAPFFIETQPINRIAAEAYRVPYAYVYGTLAREQKLSPEYLAAVAEILRQHPESGFVWTGRKELPRIRQFFREQGLSNRQTFVGWKDPDLFVNTIDCFLETFPLGGLTTFTAMAHGIPAVMLAGEHSPIGSLENAPTGLLAARSASEYVEMALSVQDRAKRAGAIEAGHQLLKAEQRQSEADKRQFWRVVEGVRPAD